jgi:xanthine dehydrogenase accessory factor
MDERRDVYPELLRRLERRESTVLATVVEAEGATPQIPGASALFGESGLLLGTLGGGMLESEAGDKALACLKNRNSLFYRFDLKGDDLTAGEPVCGGRAWILIDTLPESQGPAWRGLAEALLARRSGVLVTRIDRSPHDQARVGRLWLDEAGAAPEAGSALGRIAGELARVKRQGKPALVRGDIPDEQADGQGPQILYFLEPISPLPRLLIVGAGHIGRAVARLASRLDFDITVIDDRAEYAAPEKFPAGTSLIVSEIEPAFRQFPVSSDTYIVIVTRGHSHDADALRACIHSPAAYIGMIGSRHKVALMREHFLSEGWASAQEWDRVRTPIGLKIGSVTVEEIAVSIAAELVQVRSEVRERKARGKP